MQAKLEQLEPTKTKLTVTADPAELEPIKQAVLRQLGQNVKVPGFRAGKAPANLLEKQLDQSVFQTEFLERAVNDLYVKAIDEQRLRPVAQPQISIVKFVPFTTLEFTAESETVGEIKLPDYKKIKLPLQKVEVTVAEVNEVLESLRQRAATKSDVKRAAKMGDEVTINFTGIDAKTKEPIDGADGQDYPLVLGSKNFIPGFEEELVGLKLAESKTFDLTFPKDYGVPALQNRKVTFTVTVLKIQELELPKLDDKLATGVGPFKSLAELKSDVKKQLTAEKQQEGQRLFDNELLEKIADKTTVAIPAALVDEEINRIEEEEKRNIAYRGQTWQEHLDAEAVTAEEHRERQRPSAELRVKAGLILGEVAEEEKIQVTPEELEVRLMLLKNQYPDEGMQGELDKPENRRDVLSRMLTEKTLDHLRALATS
ncbi:MAG TPA: trigger factor [Candidatus Saccharimonadales bacterium]|jgi:trigger factor|nr:trigger factor [Candidatus Saccharimonadales bacterium]